LVSKRQQVVFVVNTVVFGVLAAAALGFMFSGDVASRTLWFSIGASSVAAVMPIETEHQRVDRPVLGMAFGSLFAMVCLASYLLH
jgi:hypothetical protein